MTPEPRPPQALQTPVHEAIARELVALAPEHWSAIQLSLTRKAYPADAGLSGEGVAHTIGSPEGHRDVIFPSEPLFVQTRSMELLFRDHGVPWRTAEYKVTREPDGDWKWGVSFTYDERQQE